MRQTEFEPATDGLKSVTLYLCVTGAYYGTVTSTFLQKQVFYNLHLKQLFLFLHCLHEQQFHLHNKQLHVQYNHHYHRIINLLLEDHPYSHLVHPVIDLRRSAPKRFLICGGPRQRDSVITEYLLCKTRTINSIC